MEYLLKSQWFVRCREMGDQAAKVRRLRVGAGAQGRGPVDPEKSLWLQKLRGWDLWGWEKVGLGLSDTPEASHPTARGVGLHSEGKPI